MVGKMKNVGTDTFTSNTEGKWLDDGTKFYFSPLVYSYTRVEWDAELEGR